MQQAGMRPDRVIGIHRIELVEAHHPRTHGEAFIGLAHHCGRAIGRIEIEAALGDPGGIPSCAAAQFEHARSGFEPVEKAIKIKGRYTCNPLLQIALF